MIVMIMPGNMHGILVFQRPAGRHLAPSLGCLLMPCVLHVAWQRWRGALFCSHAFEFLSFDPGPMSPPGVKRDASPGRLCAGSLWASRCCRRGQAPLGREINQEGACVLAQAARLQTPGGPQRGQYRKEGRARSLFPTEARAARRWASARDAVRFYKTSC